MVVRQDIKAIRGGASGLVTTVGDYFSMPPSRNKVPTVVCDNTDTPGKIDDLIHSVDNGSVLQKWLSKYSPMSPHGREQTHGEGKKPRSGRNVRAVVPPVQ